MSGILLPEGVDPNKAEDDRPTRTVEVTYEPTEEDEQKFMLLYHMHLQPSEFDRLDPEFRVWLIARFMGQKQMERAAFEQHQLMRQLGPNLRGG